jgi:hypothetical protein
MKLVRLRIFCIFILLASCSYNKKGTALLSDQKESFSAIDSSTIFLTQFSTIIPANLHVYSPFDSLGGKKFEGKIIDTSFYHFLKFKNSLDLLLTDSSSHLYSCYKFKFEENKTGLLIRRPSQYEASAIDLYIWDDSLKRIINIINLSDAFGDGDWYFVKDAWLKNINNDDHLDIITRKKEYEESDDPSIKSSITDTIKVFLGNGKNFKPAIISIDTTTFQILN